MPLCNSALSEPAGLLMRACDVFHQAGAAVGFAMAAYGHYFLSLVRNPCARWLCQRY